MQHRWRQQRASHFRSPSSSSKYGLVKHPQSLPCLLCVCFRAFALNLLVFTDKLSIDNVFKATVEVQIFVTVLVALLLKCNLAEEVVGSTFYDTVAVTLFVFNVPIAFTATCIAKLRHGRWLLNHRREALDACGALKTDSVHLDNRDVSIAFALHKAGLAGPSECAAIRQYLQSVERQQSSLREACNTGRITVFDTIRIVAFDVATDLSRLRDEGNIYCELTPRNIILLGGKWVLSDSVHEVQIGWPIRSLRVTGYSPPEIVQMQTRQQHEQKPVISATSMNVWTFGVVLYELCCGHGLFRQDASTDVLVDHTDRVRLCTWLTISDEELDRLFDSDWVAQYGHATPQQVRDAKHLIRWCLKGNPTERPTVKQVLGHRFLKPDAIDPHLQAMQYFCFLSHAQADASGAVKDLHQRLKQVGCYSWLDVNMHDLTEQGMKEGIRNSNVFVLFLSQHVLASAYCQIEINEAARLNKPVQLIIEEDDRFAPFNILAWTEQTSHKVTRTAQTMGGTTVPVPSACAQLVDDNIRSAIIFRRRKHEADAMLSELCARNGAMIPQPVTSDVLHDVREMSHVFIIGTDTVGQGDVMRTSIASRMNETSAGRLQEGTDLASADAVLVLLAEGVLKCGSASLSHIETAMQQDSANGYGRFVFAYSAARGWIFGGAEQETASQNIQQTLRSHEALSYRMPSNGASRHEFPAMMSELSMRLLKRARGRSISDGGTRVWQPPSQLCF